MHIHYWPVGHGSPLPCPLTHDQISGYLVEDWVPSLVPPPGSMFFGWPSSLIEPVDVGGTHHWSLDSVLGTTERQWKSVISWMLGVAGARHLLAEEGYRWIAPVSAFFPSARSATVAHWHPMFPPGAVGVTGQTRQPGRPIRTNLRPDYIAIRPRRVTGRRGWAAVEAKGTDQALGSPLKSRCPASWRRQAWNIRVTLHGAPIRVPRHLVVATRINPNAKKKATRCLQLRGWNSADTLPPEPPAPLVVEVAAAHLFGLCVNLGLWWNARAIALGVEARSMRAGQSESSGRTLDNLLTTAAKAEHELREQTDAATPVDRAEQKLPEQTGTTAPVDEGEPNLREQTDAAAQIDRQTSGRVRVVLNSALGSLATVIEPATTSLIRGLRSTDPEEAAAVLEEADSKLDDLVPMRTGELGETLLPSGVRVRYTPR
jgi:hypothetical protein